MQTPAHNVYTAADGSVIRLINDDVLVRMDPLPAQTRSGLFIPDTVGDRGDQGILTTGTVLAYGYARVGGKKGVPFRRIPLPELEVGMKVAFIKYYAEQHSNEQIQHRVEEGVIRMKPLDLLYVLDPEDMDRIRS